MFHKEQLKKKFSFTVTPAQGAFKFMDEAGDDEGDEEPAAAPGTLARKASMNGNGAEAQA